MIIIYDCARMSSSLGSEQGHPTRVENIHRPLFVFSAPLRIQVRRGACPKDMYLIKTSTELGAERYSSSSEDATLPREPPAATAKSGNYVHPAMASGRRTT